MTGIGSLAIRSKMPELMPGQRIVAAAFAQLGDVRAGGEDPLSRPPGPRACRSDEDLRGAAPGRRTRRAARPPSLVDRVPDLGPVQQHHHRSSRSSTEERAEAQPVVERRPGAATLASDALHQQGGALADADAHGRQAELGVASRSIRPSRVIAIRDPEEPSGWPSAIAPPSLFTISGSRPSSAHAGQRLGGERLVEFDGAEVIDAQARRGPAPCGWPGPGRCP